MTRCEGRLLPLRRHAGCRLRCRDQRAEQIDVVNGLDPLQDGRHALEPHARIDRGFGQIHAVAGAALLVLHEHEVPELKEAVAVGIRAARRAACNLVALVEEDLRAGPARPRLARRPEIIAGGDTDDLVVGETRDLLPDAIGILVVVIDGDEQMLGIEREVLGDELPGQRDRALLEVVAEGEVAEHLEERVMPVGVADVVEVVVLAAGAHALLRGGGAGIGARLLAGEHVLELHHAGGREHQGRVVARHQRRRRHHLVAVLGEEIEERRADLIDALHCASLMRPAAGAKQTFSAPLLLTARCCAVHKWGCVPPACHPAERGVRENPRLTQPTPP